MSEIEIVNTERAVDLSKPSVRALSWALRHPEMWPKGFAWNYANCETCAIGIAATLWGVEWGETRTAFGLSWEDDDRIFITAGESRDLDPESVTPDMVADDIDAYLARAGA